MKTMTTINFNENKIVLSDNLVQSDILPSSYKELGRDLIVDGETTIQGAVFAKNLFVNAGPLVIHGALFAQGEIHLKNDLQSAVTFHKAVGSGGTIVGLLTKTQVHFLADLSAKKVSLKNAFVAGSIMADEIDLESCVVLGGAFATKKLSAKNTVLGTFNSPEVLLSESIYLLFPASFAVEPPTKGVNLQVWNLTMADLGALYFGKEQSQQTGRISMDPLKDVVAVNLYDQGGNKQVLRSFSVAGKVMMADLLDFDSLYNHFILRTGTMAGHIAKTFQVQEGELKTEKVAELFFQILSGKLEVRDLVQNVTLSDLKAKYL